MNDLLNTLLECPNLSLRILDSSTGRTVKTVNSDQLHRFVQQEASACYKDCDNKTCVNKTENTEL